MFFDVFSEYDPENLLLHQARREVFELQFELGRLRATAERIAGLKLVVQPLHKPTPLAFPLFIEKMRDRLSSESLADRVRRMQAALEVEASRTLGATDPPGRDNKRPRSRSPRGQGDSVESAEPPASGAVSSEPIASTIDQG
jgi:ATP-dependent Lhr-like helicase